MYNACQQNSYKTKIANLFVVFPNVYFLAKLPFDLSIYMTNGFNGNYVISCRLHFLDVGKFLIQTKYFS